MLVQLAPGNVIPAICAFRGEQLTVEELPGFAVHFVQPAAFTGGIVVAVLRHSHSGALRQESHRLDVVKVLDSADKGDDVAAGAAAEAVVALGVRVDME